MSHLTQHSALLFELRLDTAVLCKDTAAAASSGQDPAGHDRPALLWDLTNNITFGCWKSDGADANDGYVESMTVFGFGRCVFFFFFSGLLFLHQFLEVPDK